MSNEKIRVIIIGFDGADWNLIHNWAKQGKLPNFRRLIENGTSGPLESTIPPITPPAWTSMVTGKNPGKHGIFGFIKLNYGESGWKKSIYTSKDKASLELWDYISRSIVVNVPFTYPPRQINGIMVSGMLTPSSNSEFTYPSTFKNELLANIPEYIIELDWSRYIGKRKEFLQKLYQMTEMRIRLFWKLFERRDWRLLFFVFVGSDRIQHMFWNTDELEKYWIYLDKFLGDVLDKVSERGYYLFVVSDHGFREVHRILNINNLLVEKGLLKFAKAKTKKFNISQRMLSRIYLKLPSPVRDILKPLKQKIYKPPKFDNKTSLAIGIGEGAFAGIYINPTLSNSRQEEIVEFVKDTLESLVDPETGKKPVSCVFRREEIYTGPLVNNAPDLIVLPSRHYAIEGYNPAGLLTESFFKNGEHGMDGVLFIYGGNGIKEGHLLKNATILDVSPTILHMFSLPIPKDIDGRILMEIFEEDSGFVKDSQTYVDPEYYEKKKKLVYEDKRVKAAIKKLKSKSKI